MRRVHFHRKAYRLNEPFVISRGPRTHAEVIECHIESNGHIGTGECTPYNRYNETPDTVLHQLRAWAPAIESGLSRHDLEANYPPGAARHAVDSSLWDLEAKIGNTTIWELAGLPTPTPLTIPMTISVATPTEMALKASETPLNQLKLKCAGDGHDLARIAAVREQCPTKKIMVDANESWGPNDVPTWIDHCAKESVLLCADESCHTMADLDACRPYDVINIKLDKTGGLTHALRLLNTAKASGFKVMVGCMLGSELAIRNAFYLVQMADIIDLDAPLLLSDHYPTIRFEITDAGAFSLNYTQN